MKNCVQIATAVLGCSSVAIPLHRKKQVPTASSPDRIRPVEKEEKKGKKGKRQGVKGWLLLQSYPRTDASSFPVIRSVFPAYRGKQPVETNRRGKSPFLRCHAQPCSGHCRSVVMFAIFAFHRYLLFNMLKIGRTDFSVLPV